MARYDYKCSSCGNVFEVEHPMSETPEVVCPSCGAPAAKTFSASGIKFEGSGFYNTDQRSGGSSTSATSGCCANCPHNPVPNLLPLGPYYLWTSLAQKWPS